MLLNAEFLQWEDVEMASQGGSEIAARNKENSKPVMGIAPTRRRVRTSFWDLHHFNERGQIVETWNLIDSLAIMHQLGLVASHTVRPQG